MMLGEPHRANPTVQIPPWLHVDVDDDDAAAFDDMYSPPLTYPLSGVSASSDGGNDYSPSYLQEALTALQQYRLSSKESEAEPPDYEVAAEEGGEEEEEEEEAVDAYSCDHFRMFEFKVRRCARGRSHDWTECPYAHPGEKARRRDPRKYHYSGTACPDFRKGHCKKGDCCEFAHGVFECWLHPARYRTQPCKDGTNCRRRVCFFAHTPDQLRVLPTNQAYPRTPTPVESPPMSPTASPQSLTRSLHLQGGSYNSSINDHVLLSSLRNLNLNLQIAKVKSLPSSWNSKKGSPPPPPSPGFGSPPSTSGSLLRPGGFCSLPPTPTHAHAHTPPPTRPGSFGRRYKDLWDVLGGGCQEEEPAMVRVESGRGLRSKMFQRLSEENSLEPPHSGPPPAATAAPDFGWVSELVK